MRRASAALLAALAVFAAGCHNNNLDSGYGVAWVTLTDEPGDFTSYIVNVDSVTLTRNDGAVVTALATAETVDFTKLKDISELWGSATVPIGTYLSANIVVDYTSAFINVMVNGVPTQVTVVGPTGAAVTTVAVNVILDPANPLTLQPTYATTAGERLAIDFNLPASTESLNLATSPPTLTVRPYMTAGISAPDTKLIRVRGPLINSSVNLGTYTVYVRPFHDEVDSLGSLSLFTDANTVYTIDGKGYVGSPGLSVLSQTSAGTTVTAAYATYQPTATPTASAAIFHADYVVAGSTLEDVYTSGLEGDVIARSGNTLTLRGASLVFNTGVTSYINADSNLLVGPNTQVTTDDEPGLTGLTAASIGVGQHVIARGIYTLPNNVTTLDATGSTTNTGSVRLIPTHVFGSIVSAAANNLVLNLTTINDWPVSIFNFAGNGLSAATDSSPANYVVNTGTLTIPDATAGDPSWVVGLAAPFGSAPPDFDAGAIYTEATQPASLQVTWTSPGTNAPFTVIAATGISVDLSNAALASGVIRFGAESVPLASLAASPLIVPATGTAAGSATSTTTGAAIPLAATFTPLFSVGDPTAASPGGISVYSQFAAYATQLSTVLATSPALQLEARGTYDRASNTFTATSVSLVL